MKLPEHLCANGEHKRIEVTCLDCIERLRADIDMTRKERDLYKDTMSKILDATLQFADAFAPVIPGESKINWDAAVEQIKKFRISL